jgi:NADPH:quinone reductase-like Zn-dependent oxidoreductase
MVGELNISSIASLLATCLQKLCSDKTNHENGAFGAYLTAKANLQIHIPLDVSFEEAATLGVAMVTVVCENPQNAIQL